MEGKKKMIHEVQDSGDDKEDEPEPGENIDLLIHNIDWQHAESIKCLDGSRKSIFLITKFCPFWKHSRHWVNPVLRFISKKSGSFNSILHELSTKKDVNEVNIADQIDDWQDLTNQHSDSPDIVSLDNLDNYRKSLHPHLIMDYSLSLMKARVDTQHLSSLSNLE